MERLALSPMPVTHPAIGRVLAHYAGAAPVATAAARAALTSILAGVSGSAWPEVGWSFSPLTGDGFPVEFTFSSAGEAISYAAEVSGPETPETDRLLIANGLLTRLHTVPLRPSLLTDWQSRQRGQSLGYGCWLGGRHGSGSDRYKVYAEVPPTAADAWTRAVAGVPLGLATRPLELRMVGHDPAAGRTELYFRTQRPDWWEIGGLLHRVGWAGEVSGLRNRIETLTGTAFDSGALGRHVGISLAFDADVNVLAVSLFGFARAVFRGGDASIRRGVLRQGMAQGWPLSVYEAVTDPIADIDNSQTRHGMAAFSAMADGSTGFQIGLRPPTPRP
jgi:hypothetical protein